MSATEISWTDAVANPFPGCKKCSPGCLHCYAEKMARRLKGMGHKAYQDVVDENGWTGKVGHTPNIHIPGIGKLVFVQSMGDLFYEGITDGQIMDVFYWIGRNMGRHTFQVLTKRPERAKDWFLKWVDAAEDIDPQVARGPQAIHEKHTTARSRLFTEMLETWGKPPDGCAYPFYDWAEGPRWWPNVFPNVWFGVTCENQEWADKRIPILLQIPATVRFISAEPLLGPITFVARPGYLHPLLKYSCPVCAEKYGPNVQRDRICQSCGAEGHETNHIDWVIIGSESGPHRRPCKLEWVYSLVEQCKAARIAVLVKQLDLDGKRVRDIERFPKDLQIRQYPRIAGKE